MRPSEGHVFKCPSRCHEVFCYSNEITGPLWFSSCANWSGFSYWIFPYEENQFTLRIIWLLYRYSRSVKWYFWWFLRHFWSSYWHSSYFCAIMFHTETFQVSLYIYRTVMTFEAILVAKPKDTSKWPQSLVFISVNLKAILTLFPPLPSLLLEIVTKYISDSNRKNT